jgi:hypothetical protein
MFRQVDLHFFKERWVQHKRWNEHDRERKRSERKITDIIKDEKLSEIEIEICVCVRW